MTYTNPNSQFSKRTGKALKSDGTDINIFDLFYEIYEGIQGSTLDVAQILTLLTLLTDLAEEDGMSVIDSIEAHTHQGKAYYSSIKFNLPPGTVYYIGGTNGDGHTHMKDRSVEVVSGLKDIDVSVELYEGYKEY